jgi:dihydrofolate reductase
VQSLTKLGLVDEYRLMVHPVVLGTGKRLFASAGPDLELVESRKGGPDVLLLIYRPAKSAAD